MLGERKYKNFIFTTINSLFLGGWGRTEKDKSDREKNSIFIPQKKTAVKMIGCLACFRSKGKKTKRVEILLNKNLLG